MAIAEALRRHPTATDVAIALFLTAASFVSVHASLQLFGKQPGFVSASNAGLIVALLATTLPLALRRRYPLSVATVVIGAFVVGRLTLPLEFEEPYLGVWAIYLALYTAVRLAPRTTRSKVVLALLVLVAVAEIARELFVAHDLPPGTPLTHGFLFAYNLAVLSLPLVLGWAVRSSSERQRLLAAQTVELQRERQENARRAVLEERVRIARELHDVVAHHVSVMGIQAGAARRVFGTQPEKAEEVLGTIEASSREAVTELHRLLGFLRRVDQVDAISPQPDLAQLSELLATVERAGLTVALVVAGEPRALPPTVELSAYRVIQEGLTNALKHSQAKSATLRLGYGAEALAIELSDDGVGRTEQPPAGPSGGHGLIGMRERVRLHGGHLRLGSRPEGGFTVHATFPLEAQPA